MTITATIIADSICNGLAITTMELEYPRLIHSELLTHRVLSRNASSSRAIPVKKMLANIWNNPAMPVHWGKNQAGMQAREELEGWRLAAAKMIWLWSSKMMCVSSWLMSRVGLHKQIANRVTEPWQHIRVLVTSTEWDNFYALRCHPDAQPEIQALACEMRNAQAASHPVELKVGEWHLPYVFEDDYDWLTQDEAIKVSVARCCRVSYLNNNGRSSGWHEDKSRYESLVNANPPHSSPCEHQATPSAGQHANFSGWKSHRWMLENPTHTA